MLILGFGHRARQGKNTAAQAVMDFTSLDTSVQLYAFGDSLKQEVRVACAKFGGQWQLIEAWKEAGNMPEWVHFEEPKPRSLLQWWGTDFRRKQDPDYWVKRLARKLEDHNPDVALITDVRFPNEVDFIHSVGGYVVKVERVGETDVQVHEHASEAELDAYTGWDFHIKATDLPDLKKQARKVWEATRDHRDE